MGGLLLVEATEALGAASNESAGVRAALRVSREPSGGLPAVSHTLVNQAYLPV